MAIDMSTVKAITHNNKDVVKIEDSLGNVLWTKPASATLYRELDFIKFNGAEYLHPSMYPNYNRKLDVSFSVSNYNPTYKCLFGAVNANGSSSAKMYKVFGNFDNATNQIIGNVGSVSNRALVSSAKTNVPTNKKRTLGLTTNGSNGSLSTYFYLLDENGTQKTSGQALNQSLGLPTSVQIGFGCYNSTNGGYLDFASNLNIWGIVYTNTSNNTVLKNLIPCQRKSDDKCGMYDTVGRYFYQMYGTSTTTGAAGNTVDENPSWSPTA